MSLEQGLLTSQGPSLLLRLTLALLCFLSLTMKGLNIPTRDYIQCHLSMPVATIYRRKEPN